MWGHDNIRVPLGSECKWYQKMPILSDIYWNIWSWNRGRYLQKHPDIRDKMIEELLGRRIGKSYVDKKTGMTISETEYNKLIKQK